MSEYDVSTGYSALEATSMTANRPMPLSLQPSPAKTESVICDFHPLMRTKGIGGSHVEDSGYGNVALDYLEINSTRASSKEEAKHWQSKKADVSSGS
jgi:hypothetical protein